MMGLDKMSGLFLQDFGLTVKTSAEVEFYLEGNDPEQDKECLALMLLALHQAALPIREMKKEDGTRQYEIDLPLRDNPMQTAQDIELAKRVIAEVAERCGLRAIFTPKPYPNQPGCGLHLHASLHDAAGNNVLQKPSPVCGKGLGEGFSPMETAPSPKIRRGDSPGFPPLPHTGEESFAMLHAVGGLLEIIPEAMVFFTPNEDSYTRFIAGDQHTPKYICWGGNNRTAAVRIPASTLHPESRHIELRVPGMDADPERALAAMIAGMHHGLTQKITPPPKLYGNAFDKQYGLTKLPASLDEAKQMCAEGRVLKKYS